MAKIYTKNTWQDEILSGDERYNILEDGGAAFKNNMRINLATGVVQAGSAVTAARMNNIEDGLDGVDTQLDAVSAALSMLMTGWIASSATWSYASTTTLTIPGDQTALFPLGTKVRLTQTTVKYFYVIGRAYNAPNTTLTLTGGRDYTLANAAITAPAYSYTSSPQDFPHWFNYTGTVTGTGGTAGAFAESLNTEKFRIEGKTLYFEITKRITNLGSWTGDVRVSLPCAVIGGNLGNIGGIWRQSELAPAGYGAINGTSNQITFWATMHAAVLAFTGITATAHIKLRGSAELP